MAPFVFIVYTLLVGLQSATELEEGDVKSLIVLAQRMTVVSWCTYPIVYIFPMVGLSGANAVVGTRYSYGPYAWSASPAPAPSPDRAQPQLTKPRPSGLEPCSHGPHSIENSMEHSMEHSIEHSMEPCFHGRLKPLLVGDTQV